MRAAAVYTEARDNRERLDQAALSARQRNCCELMPRDRQPDTINPVPRSFVMKIFRLSMIAVAAGVLMSAPAFAQGSMSAGTMTDQKQHTDGGDSPDNPRATDAAAAAWHKQHTDAGESPANPRVTDKMAAAWQRQHTDGGDSPDNPRALQKSEAQSYASGDTAVTDLAVTAKKQ
jgi:hypothetical protein